MLSRFLADLEELNLFTSTRVAEDLRPLMEQFSARAPNGKLSKREESDLAELMIPVMKTVRAELHGHEAYVLTPKRIDVDLLTSNVQDLFPPGVFARIPEKCRYDLREAGRCIAFERPTAAAFHLMRATEATLRAFYCLLAKRKRVSPMWGPMLQDLRARRAAKPYLKLLDTLDDIRHTYRNPTQHPDKVYDIHEVQNLWGVCTDAISRMSTTM
jgi:hypothetical protein